MKSTFILLIFATLFSCNTIEREPSDLNALPFIPTPNSVVATAGYHTINSETVIRYNDDSSRSIAEHLSSIIDQEISISTKAVNEQATESDINITVDSSKENLGTEGYEISITEDKIAIVAMKNDGAFRATETLRQILTNTIDTLSVDGEFAIATGVIKDKPRFEYRAAMLDVCRHFFSVQDVKKFIDQISLYKYNFLHLHLTDDQGWRIEIKSWPNLTKIGGSTEVGGGEGGFYTQKEYKEIVDYAATKFITIIPEIDMPGHTNAALASYGELNPDGERKELYTGIEVGFSTLMPKEEITYKFIDDVIKEISNITPGPYIHIGGDESHVTGKDDYIYFIERVQKIVKSHGKEVIGWADIASAKLNPGTISQFWQTKPKNALNAVKQNSKLIMSPADKIYLDIQYDSITPIGLHWAGYNDVDHAYNWDPATLVKEIKEEQIYGIEAPLWTETVETYDDIEYLVFPRILGYSEIGWSAKSVRSWEEYTERLIEHGVYLDKLGVNYYRSPKVNWK